MKNLIIKRLNVRKLFSLLIFVIIYNNSISQTWTEIEKLSGNAGDNYGISVAMDGDYAVVGAPYYNTIKGCVYVLQNKLGVWTQIAKLIASDGENYDWFGFSVGISGDIIVVGAMQNDYSGSAYVFKKPINGWKDTTETAKLSGSDIIGDVKFGWSVDISEDNIIIGSMWMDSKKGAAYIFTKPELGWKDTVQTAKLVASDCAIDDEFGKTVSISGNNIVIGAYSATGKGAGYIFEEPIDGWKDTTQTAKLTCSDIVSNDFFGCDVKISGDNIIIGARPNSGKGAAYIFEKPEGGWKDTTETAKLMAADATNTENFGSTVSILGNNAIVGAYNSDNRGAAYIFEKPEGGWEDMTETSKLIASDALSGNYFGVEVSICNDYVMIGDNIEDAVYIFSKEINSGIPNSSLFEVSFYPNPANSYLIINTNETCTLEIHNVQGQLILKRELFENKNEISVDNLVSGSYVIKIIEKSKIYSDILIIE